MLEMIGNFDLKIKGIQFMVDFLSDKDGVLHIVLKFFYFCLRSYPFNDSYS